MRRERGESETPTVGDPPGGDERSAIMVELAEAEAAEADALEEAALARERAAELRDDEPEDESCTDRPGSGEPAGEPPRGRRRLQRIAGPALTGLATAAALTLAALMVWQHGQVSAQRAQDRRFVDAARDGVVALLSIDHTSAEADVQRVLDLSSGQFHADFQASAEDFIQTARQSNSVSTGSISAAALDRIDGDRAVVLVAASSKVTNAGGADGDPRPFRMSVTVTRDGDTCKMSDVEFVP